VQAYPAREGGLAERAHEQIGHKPGVAAIAGCKRMDHDGPMMEPNRQHVGPPR